MDDFDKGLDDLLDMTDTDASSSSSNTGIFESKQPFVLELHELKRDELAPDAVALDSKIKKKKRKKNKPASENRSATSSTSSVSDSVPAVTDTAGKEKFYDAKESYHALAAEDSQAKPASTAALAQAHSEHASDKLERSEQRSSAITEPSTITRLHSRNLSPLLNRKRQRKPLMEKPIRYKSKTKKPAPKPKTTKKRKSDGPSCSMFLAELTRRLSHKKKTEEESTKNIVQTIVESITNALPVIFSKKTPSRKESPMKIETLQVYAPELLPNDIIDVPHPDLSSSNIPIIEEAPTQKPGFKIPKMPLVSSEVFKPQASKRIKPVTEDIAVNTGGDTDVASEIAKHVGTLRKISLIAEEFNQKTAKNLKEIVDSVQEDLIKKLEEIQAEQGASKSEKQLNIDGRHEPALYLQKE